MKIKTKNENITFYKISKDFTILVDGKELSGCRWCEQDNVFNQYDGDIEFDNKSKKIFDQLSDSKQDEIMDFIEDEIKM